MCNFDIKLYHAQEVLGAVVVLVNNPGAGLEHIGITNNHLHISITSVLVMHTIGMDMIRQLQALSDSTISTGSNSGLTIHFEPYYNNAFHLINTQYEHGWDNHTYEQYVVNTQYPTLAHHWIELVHYPWIIVNSDNSNSDEIYVQALLQVQVLIHKYELLREQYQQYTNLNQIYHEFSSIENKLKLPLYSNDYYDNILIWLNTKKNDILQLKE